MLIGRSLWSANGGAANLEHRGVGWSVQTASETQESMGILSAGWFHSNEMFFERIVPGEN
jgi:hypothetical protein